MRISDWSSDVCSSDLFFPVSDRPEVLVEVQMPEGTGIEATSTVSAKVEAWIRKQPEAKIVTTYVGQGAPLFVLNIAPELPDPSFAKIVILTEYAKQRKAIKHRLSLAGRDRSEVRREGQRGVRA